MDRLKLVGWLFIDLGMAISSKVAPAPWNDVFFVLATALLIFMTVRSILCTAQYECSKKALVAQFDAEMIKALKKQRLVMISDFRTVTGERFPEHEVSKAKSQMQSAHRVRTAQRLDERMEKTSPFRNHRPFWSQCFG